MIYLRDLMADQMLLYKHSTRCPSAIQMFLDCNPQYWKFVPVLPSNTTHGDQSTVSNIDDTLSMLSLNDEYDSLEPNYHLDLYNATIISVCKYYSLS